MIIGYCNSSPAGCVDLPNVHFPPLSPVWTLVRPWVHWWAPMAQTSLAWSLYPPHPLPTDWSPHQRMQIQKRVTLHESRPVVSKCFWSHTPIGRSFLSMHPQCMYTYLQITCMYYWSCNIFFLHPSGLSCAPTGVHTPHCGDHSSRLCNSNPLIPLIVSSFIFKLSWLNTVYAHFIHQSFIWTTMC